jgi:hypothetical protein
MNSSTPFCQTCEFEVDGRTYCINIAQHHGDPTGTVLVSFSAISQEGEVTVVNMGLTGAGHPFRVLGTVINALRRWLAQHKPAGISFAAVEDNRQSLYGRIIRRFAPAEGYHLSSSGPLGEPLQPGEFHLVRNADPVA